MNEDPDNGNVAVADPPEPTYTPAQVNAQLEAERQRLEELRTADIEARDEEWRQYLASQNEPDAPVVVDEKAIRAAATQDAITTFNDIQNARDAVLDECRGYGPDAEKLAREALAKIPAAQLAAPGNADLISAAILRQVVKEGKAPVSILGPNAANLSVATTTSDPHLSAFESAFGKLSDEEKKEIGI